MSKERLGQVKELLAERDSYVFNGEVGDYQKHDEQLYILNDDGHIDWLYQQAEEKIQLEECVKELDDAVYAINETYRQERLYNEKLEKENQLIEDMYGRCDVDWLIEQAERVQDLKIMLKVLGKQNQRYKQALEFYADENTYKRVPEKLAKNGLIISRDYFPIIEDEYGKKARQALQGGNDNE